MVVVQPLVENIPSRLSLPGRRGLVHKLKVSGLWLADPGFDEAFWLSYDYCTNKYLDSVFSPRYDQCVSLIPSKLGYVVAGTIKCTQVKAPVNTSMHISSVNQEPENDLSRRWSLDSIDIMEKPNSETTVEEDAISEGIEYVSGQYQVGLPWTKTQSMLKQVPTIS